MESHRHSTFCSFIPEELLQRLSTDNALDAHVRDAASRSLKHTRQLRSRRHERSDRLRTEQHRRRPDLATAGDGPIEFHRGHQGQTPHAQAHGHGSIIPPGLLEQLSQDPNLPQESRDAARRTLEHGHGHGETPQQASHPEVQHTTPGQAHTAGASQPGSSGQSTQAAASHPPASESGPAPSASTTQATSKTHSGVQGLIEADGEEDEDLGTLDPAELQNEELALEAAEQSEIPPESQDPDATESDPVILGADGQGGAGEDEEVAAALADLEAADDDNDNDLAPIDDTSGPSEQSGTTEQGFAKPYVPPQPVITEVLKLQANNKLVRYVYNAETQLKRPGTLWRKEGSSVSKDASVNKAYESLQTTFKFFETVYKFKPFSNQGETFHGTVHYGDKFMNAFWDGVQMVFGDGDGAVFGDFCDSISVIGHELTHGIISSTCNLEYYGESGALNEHLADVFGILLEQYVKGESAAKSDWTIGKGLYKQSPGYVRSLKNPTSGPMPGPAHYRDFKITRDDNAGVHTNSSIPNRAFYLAAVAAGGNAWATVGPVWFATMRKPELGAKCSFPRFAYATLVNANGINPKLVPIISKAWSDVGIIPSVNGKSKVAQ
jgi:hypothetical protein